MEDEYIEVLSSESEESEESEEEEKADEFPGNDCRHNLTGWEWCEQFDRITCSSNTNVALLNRCRINGGIVHEWHTSRLPSSVEL